MNVIGFSLQSAADLLGVTISQLRWWLLNNPHVIEDRRIQSGSRLEKIFLPEDVKKLKTYVGGE